MSPSLSPSCQKRGERDFLRVRLPAGRLHLVWRLSVAARPGSAHGRLVGRAAGAGSPTLPTLLPVPPLSCLLSPLGKKMASLLARPSSVRTRPRPSRARTPWCRQQDKGYHPSRTTQRPYPMSRQMRYLDARPSHETMQARMVRPACSLG